MKNKNVLVLYKLFFAGLGLVAVTTEIVTLIGRGVFVPANFFSFFTIESNIFAAAILLLSALALLRGRPAGWLDWLRGAATLYMATTGIVFAVLLSGLDANVLTAVPWDNTVLHYIMPLVLVFDWLFDPPKPGLTFRRAALWVVYPLVYVVYSLLRGPIAGWYPYPFLDPSNKGYASVAIVSVAIAAVVLGLTWLLVKAAEWNAIRSKTYSGGRNKSA